MPQQLFFRYRAFGLLLQSALPLPELRPVPDGHPDAAAPADVIVTLGPAPRPPAPAVQVVTDVWAGPDVFWMDVPGAARFLVRHGREMIVEAQPGTAEGDIRAYLLGSALGALLHQRGVLPLHASAVEVDGRAVAFIAPSGGGKSTMAMHLQHRGHRVICDDICAVEVADGQARVWPGLRNLKLWRASLGAIDRAPDGLEPVLADLDKYRLPLSAPAEDRAFDLAAVVMLEWGDAPSIARLPGAAAVGALIANTFRGQLVAPMGREAAHWRQCLAVFAAAGVRVLTRPRALDRLDEASALAITDM
jgi:hypothetical protein